jgi:tetratricopeptide (TPR) repeat protein
MKPPRAVFGLLLLFTAVFTLATQIQRERDKPAKPKWATRSQSGGVLRVLLGDSRRLFAEFFFRKAEVYFHSGYYPSIFDQARLSEEKEHAMAHDHDHDEHAEHGEAEHDAATGFLGEPTDWIDRFGRHFRITEHTHLAGGSVREILPWLRISAEMDPQRIETYTVASYWLRKRMGKVDEAEQFLREGLGANPGSYEILHELGRLYFENRHDATRTRNLWLLALRRWHQHEDKKEKPDFGTFHDLTTELAHLEEGEGNFSRAIEWLELAKPYSPHPDAVQAQIDALRAKVAIPQEKR